MTTTVTATSVTATLVANTEDQVKFSAPWDCVKITNQGTGTIYYRSDGTAATVAGVGCLVLLSGQQAIIQQFFDGGGTSTRNLISLISSATPTYTVSGINTVGYEGLLAQVVAVVIGLVNAYLPLGGGTMTGNIAMGNNKVTGSAAPTAGGDLANKTYVDALGKTFQILVTDPNGAALTTGDGKAYFYIPVSVNGMDLVTVSAAVTTQSSSGIPTIQIANVTDGVDMLSTKLTIDANESTSFTAATPAVIDTSKDDVVSGDILRIDVDVAGTGAKGLMVSLGFRLP